MCKLLQSLLVFLGTCGAIGATAVAAIPEPQSLPTALPIGQLARQLSVGDIVFIRVDVLPFRKVADATGSWTNHVGVVVDIDGAEPTIAESTVPLAKTTPLSKFVGRSELGRVAVMRMRAPLDAQKQVRIRQASEARMGIRYDTGFDLASKGLFCSRLVYEVFLEATGTEVGEVENFGTLLTKNPQADLRFWKAWFLGSIPWSRKTVTPASVMHSKELSALFDGYVR